MTATAWKVALVATLAASAACTKSAPAPAVREHADSEFGFRFSYPDDWVLDDQAGADRRDALAREAAADANQMAEAQKQQRQLVSVFKKDAQGRVAGRLSVFVVDATPAAFLAGYLKMLNEGIKGPDLPQVHETKTGMELAGHRYDLARLTVSLQGKAIDQELYVTSARGHAVMFALTSDTPAFLQQLKDTMRSVRWDGAPDAATGSR